MVFPYLKGLIVIKEICILFLYIYCGSFLFIYLVLDTFPLYQCSFILALVGVMNQISINLINFLWKGVIMNTKKYHIINCKVVTNPKDRGGLGIKDPIWMNLALGSTLIWRMITGKLEWWKKIDTRSNLGDQEPAILENN
jgi:hypothetical protein